MRSIALVVHHIQATHSAGTRCGAGGSRWRTVRTIVGKRARDSATPEASDGFYPLSRRCLHICPKAHNGHGAQFACAQCASRCALRRHQQGPRNGSRRYVTNCILQRKNGGLEEEEKKRRKKKEFCLPSFFFSRSASDWRRIPFLPSHSFVFGERLYLEEGWGRLRTPTGEGPACVRRSRGAVRGTGRKGVGASEFTHS